jgi:arsenate reductase
MEIEIPLRLMTLGHPQRLALFRLLMRRYPDRVPAGEIAGALDLKASTLSTYLASLVKAGLITQDRSGTSLLYAIDMENVRQTFDFLLVDCCRGRPDICYSAPAEAASADRKFNVLFVCTGNSARSIFAETLLRDLAGDRFNAFSAGTRPGDRPSPAALDLLSAMGHDVTGLRPKHVTEFSGPDAPDFDFVFTVCNRAANEECPPRAGQPINGHWGVPDPARAEGTEAEKALAFEHAYGALKRRIEAFTALPVASLDRLALQSAVDEIGRDNGNDKT